VYIPPPPPTPSHLFRYEYDRDIYVWPSVKELSRSSGATVPPKLLKVMEMFLVGYSGVCNFNYKLR
jgi:hypothetical protein